MFYGAITGPIKAILLQPNWKEESKLNINTADGSVGLCLKVLISTVYLVFCFVQQVHDGKNLKGRANDAIASACLYIACRQEGVPRTFKASLLNSSPYELLLTMFIK